MTRNEYVNHLTALYVVANMSDTETRKPWQKPSDCGIHCRAIETILRDMLTPAEYKMWLDTLPDEMYLV